MPADAHRAAVDHIEATVSMLSGSLRAFHFLIVGEGAQLSTGLRVPARPNMANIRKVIPIWGCNARCCFELLTTGNSCRASAYS